MFGTAGTVTRQKRICRKQGHKPGRQVPGRKDKAMWKIVVDTSPEIIPGTNGCHKYVFARYKTKREAEAVKAKINGITGKESAKVEKE